MLALITAACSSSETGEVSTATDGSAATTDTNGGAPEAIDDAGAAEVSDAEPSYTAPDNDEDLARSVAGAVFHLTAESQGSIGEGTAWLIAEDLAVTAAHNTAGTGQPNEEVTITLTSFEGEEINATVVDRDDMADVALLKLDQPVDHPPLARGTDGKPGRDLMTIGNPVVSASIGDWIVTTGHEVANCEGGGLAPTSCTTPSTPRQATAAARSSMKPVQS